MKTMVLLYDTSCILRDCDSELFSKGDGKRNDFCISGGKSCHGNGRIPD